MSIGPLPRQADIRKLASIGAVFEGSVKVAELDRLRQAVAEDSASIEYCLRFGVTEEGILSVAGQLAATVSLLCQRCLEPMNYPIQSDFLLGVVNSDERARHLPKRLEPLVLEDELVDIAAILEEEVLLCLPIVSYHPQDECAQRAGYQSIDDTAEVVEAPKRNPFDVLAELKKPEP